MNFLSRSSRATGPNTRVPTGSPASLISTAALLVEADVGPVAAAVLLAAAHDHGLHHLALLHRVRRVGGRFLHVGRDDVAQARVAPRGPPSGRIRRACGRRSCRPPRGSFASGSWRRSSPRPSSPAGCPRPSTSGAPAHDLLHAPALVLARAGGVSTMRTVSPFLRALLVVGHEGGGALDASCGRRHGEPAAPPPPPRSSASWRFTTTPTCALRRSRGVAVRSVRSLISPCLF